MRIRDGWNHPIRSLPGPIIEIIDRISINKVTYEMPGTTTKAINMGSYNYLGFAENSGSRVDLVANEISQYGCSTLSCRSELG